MSKARDDLPEPDSPVTTISLFLGKSRLIDFRLWVFAPRIEMCSIINIDPEGKREIMGKTVRESKGLERQRMFHVKEGANKEIADVKKRAPVAIILPFVANLK